MPKPIRTLGLLFASAGAASGQLTLFDLATAGDGHKAYFASTLALKGSGDFVSTSALDLSRSENLTRIYSLDETGPHVYMERLPIELSSPHASNFYALSFPQLSRDGKVTAVLARRECFEPACTYPLNSQTSVSGTGRGQQDFFGWGRLSGNGKYLLLRDRFADELGALSLVNLDTSEVIASQTLRSGAFGPGRMVADDGTAVTSYIARGSDRSMLAIIRGSSISTTQMTGAQPVIDAAGMRVAYWRAGEGDCAASIWIYGIADNSSRFVACVRGRSSSSLFLSADGSRAMFMADESGLVQVYIVNTDGTGLRQVTREQFGVGSAAMSDDGMVIWYLSCTGRIYQVNLETGIVVERLARTPQVLGSSLPMVPGSVKTFAGIGLTDSNFETAFYPLPQSAGGVSLYIDGIRAPLLSVTPTSIYFQVPWRVRAGIIVPVQVTNDESPSPFESQLSSYRVPFADIPRFLGPPIHENWEGPVTMESPAVLGEIIHWYGTGFGPVRAPPPDGVPGPADASAAIVGRMPCWTVGPAGVHLDVPVLFAGVAPGFIGIYQLDFQVPTGYRSGSPMFLACQGQSAGILSLLNAVVPIKPQ